MSSGERFAGYPARFGYATSQTMDITDLQAWELDTNNTKTAITPPGTVDPATYLTPRSRPEFRMRTRDLSTVLGTVSLINGKCFDETSYFQLQERADCSTFLAGSTHIQRRTAKGFMFVDSITAEQDSEDGAMLSLRYIPLKASGSSLVTHTSGAALLGTPGYVSSYFLASPYHNSAEIKGVIGITLNMNITFQPAPSTPGAFDELGSIVQRQPEFTFRLLKADVMDSFQLTGNPVNSSFAFYLQKADPTNSAGDGRVAKGSSAHVKISFTGGDIETRSLSVDGLDDAVTEVSVKPTGTVAVSASSTIP